MKSTEVLAGVHTHTGSLNNKRINIIKEDRNIIPVPILDTG